MDTITGQITYRRAISKKLVFYDICLTGTPKVDSSAAEEREQSWVEVVVKLGTYGSSVQDIKDLRDKVKLGDVVLVTGTFETSHVMQAALVTVLQPWRDQDPTTAFTPQPSPLHHKAKSEHLPQQHQQPPQEQQQQQEQPLQQQQQGHIEAGAVESDSALAVIQQAAAAEAAGGDASGVRRQPPQSAAAESAAAATVQQPQLAVCKFWVNTGRCAKGTACPYAHLADGRTTWVKRRRRERQLLSSHLGITHDADSAATKGKRAQLFAAWLVDTFGKDALNAGGAGGMTYELSVVHGIKCTLVDPRPLKLNKQQHKQLKAADKAAWLQLWTAEQLQQGSLEPALKQLTPQQLQQQQEQLSEAAHLEQQQQPAHKQQPRGLEQLTQKQLQEQLSHATQLEPAHNQQPLKLELGSMQVQPELNQVAHQDRSSLPPPVVQFRQVQGWFAPELWRSSAFQQLLGSCSLVLGLHPDEATEPIVDYALESKVPFAVMPCCVFPRLFPDRKHARDGQLQHVESYADLVEYLTAKGQGKQEVLKFVGANVVVYRQV